MAENRTRFDSELVFRKGDCSNGSSAIWVQIRVGRYFAEQTLSLLGPWGHDYVRLGARLAVVGVAGRLATPPFNRVAEGPDPRTRRRCRSSSTAPTPSAVGPSRSATRRPAEPGSVPDAAARWWS